MEGGGGNLAAEFGSLSKRERCSIAFGKLRRCAPRLCPASLCWKRNENHHLLPPPPFLSFRGPFPMATFPLASPDSTQLVGPDPRNKSDALERLLLRVPWSRLQVGALSSRSSFSSQALPGEFSSPRVPSCALTLPGYLGQDFCSSRSNNDGVLELGRSETHKQDAVSGQGAKE